MAIHLPHTHLSAYQRTTREEGEEEAERSGQHRVGRAVGCPEGVFLFVLDAAMHLGFCGQAR